MGNPKEVEQAAGEVASKRYTRSRISSQAEFVARTFLWLSIAATGKGVADIGVAQWLNAAADNQMASTHPDLVDHSSELSSFNTNVVNKKRIPELRDFIDSEEFLKMEVLYEQQQLRDQLRSELFVPYQGLTSLVGDGSKGAAGVFFGVLGMIGGFLSYFKIRDRGMELATQKKKFGHELMLAVNNYRPDWLELPPSPEEMGDFFQGLLYLPPVGGKISVPGKIDGFTILEPSFTVEHQVEDVSTRMNAGEFGDSFIHQLTVQGRMPDRFKYTALALILGNPHKDDWQKTYFSTPWGKVAPLIHDGGKTVTDLNPNWMDIDGRTDFIRRIVFINSPELQIMEPARLALEARAWQRLALALHAEVGTAPTGIPQDTRNRLAREWQTFESRMDHLMREFGIENASQVPWFKENLSDQFGFKNRYEAEWEPIQQTLFQLEEVRWQYPAIQEQAVDILRDATSRIDQVIGLVPTNWR